MNSHPLFKQRYLILSFCLLIIALVQLNFGIWRGDFYEHLSVVRELSTHPFSPTNPRFLSVSPHAFFSPYLLVISFFVRITGLSPITLLLTAGFFNILLFLFSFKLFIDSLYDDQNVSFYSLLLMLLCWGHHPWSWSSFFNFQAFFWTLPYPSFFAMGLTFLSFVIYLNILRAQISKSYYILILLFTTIIIITHPVTSLFLFTGFIAFLLGSYKSSKPTDYLLLFLILGISIILTCSWPYFSFIKLVHSNSYEFDLDSHGLYSHTLLSIFPCLIGLPLIGRKIKSNNFDQLSLIFLALCFLYFYGFITGHYAYGRVISYIVIILQIVIAEWLAVMEAKFRSGKFSELVKNKFVIPVIIFISFTLGINLILASYGYIRGLEGNNLYKQLEFLTNYVGQYDLILSDINTSWVIPAIDGKVIASLHAEAFVSNSLTRKVDVNEFFGKNLSSKERIAIIEKYKPKFILLDKDQIISFEYLLLFCKTIGDVIYSDNRFILLKMHYPLKFKK